MATNKDQSRVSEKTSVRPGNVLPKRYDRVEADPVKEAERLIKETLERGYYSLVLADLGLEQLPESLWECQNLTVLIISGNRLKTIPKEIEHLKNLWALAIGSARLGFIDSGNPDNEDYFTWYIGDATVTWQSEGNGLLEFPEGITHLKDLSYLSLAGNEISTIPNSISEMTGLEFLQLQNNHLVDLPDGFGALKRLRFLYLEGNPLSSEIEAAYKQGPGALRNWLQRRQKRGREIVYKGKLVFIGEGNVGKSRLLAALRGDQWLDKGEAGTTHGIQIKPLKLLDAASGTTAECNCWDFGGQAVYRPTHQLFFSRPAIISGYRRYGATLTAPRKIVTRGRFMACFCNSWSNLTSPIAC